MANNVTFQTGPLATLPDGTIVATTDTGNGQVQIVKVAYGGDDTAIPVEATHPLPVIEGDLMRGGGEVQMFPPYVSESGNNETVITASPGWLRNVQASNTNAAARYLKIYNTSDVPVIGEDELVKIFLIPGSATGASLVVEWTKGLPFVDGIAFALTAGVAFDNTDPVDAGEIVVNIDYIEET